MSKKIYLQSAFAYREDTLENWLFYNPILEKGEVSIVRDGIDGEWLKIGDGVTRWVNLPYKKGPRGDAGPIGPQGPAGDNYVLTEADKEEIADMAKPEIDQTYNPESENAQSGKAVAEAFKLKNFELLSDTTITEDVNEVVWNTTDSGEPLTNYKDFFIYFLGKHTETKSDIMYCRANDGGLYFMWLGFSKSTDIKGFWIMIEELIQTDKIEAYPNHATCKGTKMYKTTFPNGLLGNVNEEKLTTQGLYENNKALYSDFTIGAINEPINKLHIGQTTSATSIFASGSRFLLFGRKA